MNNWVNTSGEGLKVAEEKWPSSLDKTPIDKDFSRNKILANTKFKKKILSNLTLQIECIKNSWDLYQKSRWERSHTAFLKRRLLQKNKIK